jgi:hypothetical protein
MKTTFAALAAAGLLFAGTAFAAENASQGASESAPGHQSGAASEAAPGHQTKEGGAPGASEHAPGHQKSESSSGEESKKGSSKY